MFVVILAISTTVLLSLSDKIIEHFWPNSKLNAMSDDLHNVMINLDDHEDQKNSEH